MPRKLVTYYFAFPSPFAALADSRIDALILQAGGDLDPIPVVPPQQPPPTGLAAQLQEFKLSYMLEDTERWARKLGLPWKVPEPRIVDSTDAAAGYYFARAQGNERAYRNSVFRARWGEGRNIADRQVLAACAEQVGLSRAEFVRALDDQPCRDEVPKALGRCLEDRVFGVPLFVVDGKRFWGNDRLDFLVEEVARG